MSTDNALRQLLGQWQGEEQLASTRWGEGGSATGHVSARLALDGKAVLLDYREARDGHPALLAHAVFTAGPEPGEYALNWFDNYGFVPTQPAPGHGDGARLVFLRGSPRGQTRHTYVFHSDDRHELTLESSFDGGVHWEPVMHGVYRRIA